MVSATSAQTRSLSELLAGLADVGDLEDATVSGLKLDSRRIARGDLFLALSGQRCHGLDYLPDVVRAGAAAVAWESARSGRPAPRVDVPGDTRGDVGADILSIEVDRLYQRAGPIAGRFFGHPSEALRVTGVTGTNGKTSVTQYIAQAVSDATHHCGVIGTLGYGLFGELESGARTTPDAVDMHRLLAEFVEAGCELAAVEVSSHALDQGRVEGIAFDIAVFTNLTHEHLDYHGDMAAYGASKRRLFEWPGLSTAVVNLDDEFGRELAAGIGTGVCRITYSLHRQDADIHCQDLEVNADGSSMVVNTPWGSSRIESSLLGSFNVSNLLAVIGVLGALDMGIDDIAARVNRIQTVAGRMERFGGGDRPRLVVDYAHTPEALREVLGALQLHCGGDLWVVFGCGGERDREKRALMGGIAEALADHVVLTDDNPRGEDPERILEDILVGVSRRDAVDVIRDRRGAITHAVNRACVGDVILVAGKGHEDYQDTRDGRAAYSDRETAAVLVGKPGEGP